MHRCDIFKLIVWVHCAVIVVCNLNPSRGKKPCFGTQYNNILRQCSLVSESQSLHRADIYAVPPRSSDVSSLAVAEQKTKAEEAYVTIVFTLAAQSPILLYVKGNNGDKSLS